MIESSAFVPDGIQAPDSSPNPQGKGLVPILGQLDSGRMVVAPAKDATRLLTDYLVSALVLSASFRFKPVPFKHYYLYWKDGWQLSMIGPDQWPTTQSGSCVGVCQLQSDCTWHLNPDEGLATNDEVNDALDRFSEQFVESVCGEELLHSQLPFYHASLPFWQRIHAHALAKSLSMSLSKSGFYNLSGKQLLGSGKLSMMQLSHDQTD